METLTMELPDLGEAKATEEINHLAYDPSDYPGVEVMLEFIHNRKSTKRIGLKELSVNGSLIEDAMQTYLGTRPHIGSSDLKEVLKSPLAFYHSVHAPLPEKKTSSAFELGTFAHQAFLEPDLFNKCICEPDASLASLAGADLLINFYIGQLSLRQDAGVLFQRCREGVLDAGLDMEKLAGKKAYLEQLRELSGLVGVKETDKLIIDVLKRHYTVYGGGIIKSILSNAKKEVSFYGSDPETGFALKVRPDAFNIEENIGVNAVISFKTTSAETVDKFIYDAAKYKYDLSEGMYQQVMSQVTGRKFNTTIMIMLQTVPPFAPAVFWWDAEDLTSGKYKFRYALDMVRDCYDKGLFPGFDALAEEGHEGIINMKLPDWSHKLIHPVDIDN